MLKLLRYMQGTAMFRVHVYWKSFVHKIQKELEVPSRDVLPVAKPQKGIHTVPQFVQGVQNIINAIPRTSTRAISRDLQVSNDTILNVVHEDIQYKLYINEIKCSTFWQTQE